MRDIHIRALPDDQAASRTVYDVLCLGLASSARSPHIPHRIFETLNDAETWAQFGHACLGRHKIVKHPLYAGDVISKIGISNGS